MSNKQNALTRTFIMTVNSMKDRGVVSSYNDLADKIGFNRTSMSNVINGRRNVPTDIYQKFAEMFHTDTSITTTESHSLILTKVLLNEAMLRVMLKGLAEILASQRGEPEKVVLSELEAAVNRSAESGIKKL
jgi:hypothetical protein